MTVSRRALLGGAGGSALLGLPSATDADAETYLYDELGRLKRVTYTNGVFVDYRYDAAGNRFQVQGNNFPPSGMVAAILVSGSPPVNLRTLANAAGYTGSGNATLTFIVGSGVTITGAAGTSPYPSGLPAGNAGGIAIDTGDWPTSAQISLTLEIQSGGKVYGGGGGGGANTGNGSIGYAGGVGGDALYCRAPISVVIQNGGELCAGGGGGGSGGSGVNASGGPPQFGNGGGGGGGFPNGQRGVGANNGASGTTTGGGVGGAGTTVGGAVGGAGGRGGTSTAGLSGAGGAGNQSAQPGGAGGAAGYAIRKHTGNLLVNVASYGVIGGAVAI